jgi:hypothetical protein
VTDLAPHLSWLPALKRGSDVRWMAALEPEIVGVGHGDPITQDAAERVHGLVA